MSLHVSMGRAFIPVPIWHKLNFLIVDKLTIEVQPNYYSTWICYTEWFTVPFIIHLHWQRSLIVICNHCDLIISTIAQILNILLPHRPIFCTWNLLEWQLWNSWQIKVKCLLIFARFRRVYKHMICTSFILTHSDC